MAAALSAVEHQVLVDTLQVVDGGYITIRSGRYCVCPRHTNQHTVGTHEVFMALERGLVAIRNQHVHVTPAGWAFCGLA
jgi:hypothetical protein